MIARYTINTTAQSKGNIISTKTIILDRNTVLIFRFSAVVSKASVTFTKQLLFANEDDKYPVEKQSLISGR